MLITHPALVVQVVGVLFLEIITAAIYRTSFTSASDEKHPIIPAVQIVEALRQYVPLIYVLTCELREFILVTGNDHCHIDQIRDTKAYVELLPSLPGLCFFLQIDPTNDYQVSWIRVKG